MKKSETSTVKIFGKPTNENMQRIESPRDTAEHIKYLFNDPKYCASKDQIK